MTCATDDAEFLNNTQNYFADPFSMLFDFCNAQNSLLACGYPNGNNTIVANNNTISVTINQTALGYGNMCAYRVHTGCGYPKFNIAGKNLDVKLAFNTKRFDDDDDDDDDFDDIDFDDGTITHNSTWDNDMEFDFDDDFDWTMPKNLKTDYFNQTLNRTVCINTEIYLAVINLDKPAVNQTTAFLEARQLAATTA